MTIDEVIAYAMHTSYNVNPAVLSGMLESLKNEGGRRDEIVNSIIDRTITSLSSDTLTSIGGLAFQGCYSLATVNFPAATSIGFSAFNGCSSLTTIDLPLVTSIGNYAFADCSALTTVDFPAVTSIDEGAFGGCTVLTTVILRKNQVVTLSDAYAFEGADNAIIYVPDDLVASYKADANWSSLASRIKGISELPTT